MTAQVRLTFFVDTSAATRVLNELAELDERLTALPLALKDRLDSIVKTKSGVLFECEDIVRDERVVSVLNPAAAFVAFVEALRDQSGDFDQVEAAVCQLESLPSSSEVAA